MMRRTVFAIGFFAGVVIGAVVSFETPAANAILTLPLKWFTEDLHPFPSESPANLIIAWPLWFFYWGCLGALLGLLLQTVIRMLMKPRAPDNERPQ